MLNWFFENLVNLSIIHSQLLYFLLNQLQKHRFNLYFCSLLQKFQQPLTVEIVLFKLFPDFLRNFNFPFQIFKFWKTKTQLIYSLELLVHFANGLVD